MKAVKKHGAEKLVKNSPEPKRVRWAQVAGTVLFWCALALFAAAGVSGALPGEAARYCALGSYLLLPLSLLMMGLHRALEWERFVILRLGKFHRVRGPGLFFIIPFIDRAASAIDIRIRVTDFSAQETLTRDSVTVTVDALCFWLVWDPEKAALEVQNYAEAVILSSKTALRNAISRHNLSTFLEHGEVIARQIQDDVDKKTTEWGITVQYIEITDIQIPEQLQDSLSRLAQAEREKSGRVLLAEAEIEIARKLQEAVEVYASSEPALKLKILSILNEGLKAGNSMMLVPTSITEELNASGSIALAALEKAVQKG
ncbi:MAG: slipin family protein [Spirochaetaceae bacterium]|jgi:regulator of protease activity HflC (stomatin/prohibitin superfamily)|nr:slipin family protein [Spirochaetaceae bacterium]